MRVLIREVAEGTIENKFEKLEKEQNSVSDCLRGWRSLGNSKVSLG